MESDNRCDRHIGDFIRRLDHLAESTYAWDVERLKRYRDVVRPKIVITLAEKPRLVQKLMSLSDRQLAAMLQRDVDKHSQTKQTTKPPSGSPEIANAQAAKTLAEESPSRRGGMYCSRCGALNDDNAYRCTRCGALLHTIYSGTTKIPNHLIPAILVTIFCCMPFGIPAIVYAAQVDGKISAGNIPAALEASRKAKMWCWIAFGSGLAIFILWILGTLLTAALEG